MDITIIIGSDKPKKWKPKFKKGTKVYFYYCDEYFPKTVDKVPSKQDDPYKLSGMVTAWEDELILRNE